LAQPIFACSDDKKQALITKPLKSWPYGHLDGALPYLDVANPFIVVDAPDRAPAGGPTENIQVGLASRTFITDFAIWTRRSQERLSSARAGDLGPSGVSHLIRSATHR
jgi:hypothetical protein